MIDVEAVTCVRGGRTVLDDVSLTVTPGRVLALVGPNGAGKSTLLSVMTGDIPITHGAVRLEGRPLQAWTTRELAQRRAVLLQDNEVAFSFTAREVIEMGRAPWPAEPDADESRVRNVVAETDTEHLIDRAFRTLSGGERARVSLARVLAQDTPTVLLDEPTASLDLQHQEAVMRTARRLASAGQAVAVVLHDLSLAAAYADDVAVLARGRLAAFGSPSDVLTPQLIHEVYAVSVHVVTSPDGHLVVIPQRDTSPADLPPQARTAAPDFNPPLSQPLSSRSRP